MENRFETYAAKVAFVRKLREMGTINHISPRLEQSVGSATTAKVALTTDPNKIYELFSNIVAAGFAEEIVIRATEDGAEAIFDLPWQAWAEAEKVTVADGAAAKIAADLREIIRLASDGQCFSAESPMVAMKRIEDLARGVYEQLA